MSHAQTHADDRAFTPYEISRPDTRLLYYYLLIGILTGPLFPVTFVPLWLKYITLRYKFDEEGISMSWGVLFRKEILLTYRRIQDIHLTRNVVQRWLDLSTVAIQTASGAAGAEMRIEGIVQAEPLRNFLYERMRGAKGVADGSGTTSRPTHAAPAGDDEALGLLREIRDSLRRAVGGSAARQDGQQESAGS